MYIDMIFSGIIVSIIVGMVFLSSYKVVRPTHRGFVEHGGTPVKFVTPGTIHVTPILEKLVTINVTETTLPIKEYHVITKDNILCVVDVVVYYKIVDSEQAVKNLLYNVDNYTEQIQHHIKSDLLDIFSHYTFAEAKRSNIGQILYNNAITLSKFYTITRIELKKITPPEEIQKSFDRIIIADNEKRLAEKESEKMRITDNAKNDSILSKAESIRKAHEIETMAVKKKNKEIAESTAETVKIINDAYDQSFKRNMTEMKSLFDGYKKEAIKKLKENKND